MKNNTLDKVYVVMGQTGEYSDHTEWYVCFYPTEAEAQALVEFLTAKAKSFGAWGYEGNKTKVNHYKLQKAMEPYDPGFRCDYTGFNYSAFELSRGPLTPPDDKMKALIKQSELKQE